jgi:hypothetical protein
VRFSEKYVMNYLENISTTYRGDSLARYSDQIFTSTEGMPLEVDKFVRTVDENCSFDAILHMYHKNRSEQFMNDCTKFYKQLDDDEMVTYTEILAKILGCLPCTMEDDIESDKRMVICREIPVCVTPDDSSSETTQRVKVLYLVPVCQFARQALEDKFAAVDLDKFCSLTETYLKQKAYPSFMKFGAVERYIIKMMSFRPFEIKPWHCNEDEKNFVAADGRGDASDYAITVDKLSVRHFTGGSVPDVTFEDRLTLYVPDCSTYQGFDVYLFVPQNSAQEARLYAFKITGATDVHEHVASDIRSLKWTLTSV